MLALSYTPRNNRLAEAEPPRARVDLKPIAVPLFIAGVIGVVYSLWAVND